jgi:hypothetical protein
MLPWPSMPRRRLSSPRDALGANFWSGEWRGGVWELELRDVVAGEGQIQTLRIQRNGKILLSIGRSEMENPAMGYTRLG